MAVRGQPGQQYCRRQRIGDAVLLQGTGRRFGPVVAIVIQVGLNSWLLLFVRSFVRSVSLVDPLL